MVIPLRYRNGTVRAWTTVDRVDFEQFGEMRWSLQRGRYAGRMNKRRQIVYLHRAVLGLEYGDPLQADHINGDKLDNRRANLRIVTRSQNKQNLGLAKNNTSGYRGVYWCKYNKAWVANLHVDGRHVTVGYFKTPTLANEAVVAAREELMPFSVG